MRLRLGTLATVASVSLLASCAGFEATSVHNEATATTPQGSAFQNALYKEYMGYDDYEYGKMMHWKSTDFYSAKAMQAARGETPAISEISSRVEPADKVDELTAARARLVAALPTASTTMPEDAAKAQAAFECWMEQQEENFQPKDIAACRDLFYAELKKIEPAPVTTPETISLQTDVFFDFNKSVIKPEAMPKLDEVAAMLVKDTTVRVVVEGYTDTPGPKPYNQKLSVKRATVVAKYLENKGVTQDRMTIVGYGETKLAVPTPDNTPEPRNRRVEIRKR